MRSDERNQVNWKWNNSRRLLFPCHWHRGAQITDHDWIECCECASGAEKSQIDFKRRTNRPFFWMAALLIVSLHALPYSLSVLLLRVTCVRFVCICVSARACARVTREVVHLFVDLNTMCNVPESKDVHKNAIWLWEHESFFHFFLFFRLNFDGAYHAHGSTFGTTIYTTFSEASEMFMSISYMLSNKCYILIKKTVVPPISMHSICTEA